MSSVPAETRACTADTAVPPTRVAQAWHGCVSRGLYAHRLARAARTFVFAAVSILIGAPLGESALGAQPGWWHDEWPYRVRIQCKADEGDVAAVRVPLAGRATPDGHDLRLVDVNGELRGFEVVHHDPRLSTLIQFEVPPDRPLTTWLYYGNADAPRIDTRNPQLAAWQEIWNAWSKQEAERQRTLERRRPLEERLDRLRANLERAKRAGDDSGNLEGLIAQCEKELAELVVPDATPAPVGKPEAWYPRRGVLLRVYRKPNELHPKTLTELRKLIRTGRMQGACFCGGIADGFNRFGPSDHYVSVYEGYLQIDEPGTYAFCTVSDDGSWLRVNDHTVLEWPGAHGWAGAERGQKNAELKLTKGVAQVQYYHEEGTGAQMAFLGWKPPNAERFWSIPSEKWLSVRPARTGTFEARDKPILAVPIVRVLNTYWVRDSDDRQATLVELGDVSRSRAGKIVKTRWSFGDGLTAEGTRLRHVYFRTGRPTVKLTVTDERGNHDSITCAPNVFYVDVRARYFRYGNAQQYAEAAAGYDVERMSPEDLELYAEFWGYLENWAEHVRAVNAFIRRCPDSPLIPRLAASAAKGCTQAEAYDPERADELYEIALRGADGPRGRLELNLQRARVLAWDLSEYERARGLLNSLLDRMELKAGRAIQRLRRQTLILLGDVALLTAAYDDAENLYRQAQELSERKVEQAEMLVKAGSYGYTVEDLLARGEFEWALKTLDRWEEEFPVQKLEGYTLFLRGKVLYVQSPGRLAARYLERAERVSPRAVHVPETVWLRANCLLAMQQYDEALAEFLRVRNDFTQSEFFEQAADKIKLCESELAKARPAKTGE
jgi:tetratricopeptide (TPR) repeat protein